MNHYPYTDACVAFLKRNRNRSELRIPRTSRNYRLASDMEKAELLECVHYDVTRETTVYVITSKGKAVVNPHERAARTAKAHKLADTVQLFAEYSGRDAYESSLHFNWNDWNTLAFAAAVRVPSTATIALVRQILGRRRMGREAVGL